jgi:hypothetical protein
MLKEYRRFVLNLRLYEQRPYISRLTNNFYLRVQEEKFGVQSCSAAKRARASESLIACPSARLRFIPVFPTVASLIGSVGSDTIIINKN